jgi:hypothetical protein
MKYEIWIEGYRVTGNSSDATLLGTQEGQTFKEACIAYVKRTRQTDYNEERNSIWGCRLFDNEIDARKSFG